MSASVRDLLAEAERTAWDVAVGVRDPRALVGAWPEFHHRATQALAAVPEGVSTQISVDRAVAERDTHRAQLDASTVAHRADADPRVLRVGQLLGAAADLVAPAAAGEPDAPDSLLAHGTAWRARVAEITGTIARTTRESLQETPGAVPDHLSYLAGLQDVERRSAELTARAMPADRHSVMEDVFTATPRLSEDVHEVLSAWAVQARQTLAPDNPTPSVADIKTVTADLTLLGSHTARVVMAEARDRGSRPGQLDRVREDLNAATLGWRDVHGAWPGRVFGPSPATRRQLDASEALHRCLDTVTRPHGTWRTGAELVEQVPDLATAAAALRQVTATSHELASQYQRMPAAHLQAGRLIAPARALDVSTRADDSDRRAVTKEEATLLQAQRTGSWVTLAPVDLRAVTTAIDAQPAKTRQARAAVRASVRDLPPAPAEQDVARRASAAAFPALPGRRGTRQENTTARPVTSRQPERDQGHGRD